MNGRNLGREIARATSVAIMRDDLNRAAAGHLARLALVEIAGILPHPSFAAAEAMHGPEFREAFATGGRIASLEIFGDRAEGRLHGPPGHEIFVPRLPRCAKHAADCHDLNCPTHHPAWSTPARRPDNV